MNKKPKMRQLFFMFFCCFSLQMFAQEQQLAFQYFRNGEYEKAVSIYKNLHEKHPHNPNYTKYLIDCYQQLENYGAATNLIENQLKSSQNQDHLYVELGYNFQLQHMQEEANLYYEKALKSVEKSSNLAYAIGKTFQDNFLLDYALLTYKKAMEVNPSANFNFQLALIYGEKAEIEKMFMTYLDQISINEKYLQTSKRYIGRFISDDAESEHNITLRKLLLKRLQNNPHNSWNQLLSWLYMQQKEFDKAFVQEKALYKRDSKDLKSIIEIGEIAFDNKDYEVAKECFIYSFENSSTLETELIATLYLLQISINSNSENEIIESQFQLAFSKYGKDISTIRIQALYSEFLTFNKNEPEKSISTLKEMLKLPLNKFQKGYVKTKLADILVFTNQFNTALIYYTQVQNNLKNHEIGQTARFKIAQTSYFKGDFEWAQSQLKVLKNSTSQLIANDALNLNLLITDNIAKDSLRTALKKYAVAELLSFQNKDQQAIDTLQVVLDNFKGHSIEDEALFKQAQLFEKLNKFESAKSNYLQIIALKKDDILADNAYYYLAELYLNEFNDIENAKKQYQIIIFEYPSSIFLVDARKKYRNLRGDEIY